MQAQLEQAQARLDAAQADLERARNGSRYEESSRPARPLPLPRPAGNAQGRVTRGDRTAQADLDSAGANSAAPPGLAARQLGLRGLSHQEIDTCRRPSNACKAGWGRPSSSQVLEGRQPGGGDRRGRRGGAEGESEPGAARTRQPPEDIAAAQARWPNWRPGSRK